MNKQEDFNISPLTGGFDANAGRSATAKPQAQGHTLAPVHPAYPQPHSPSVLPTGGDTNDIRMPEDFDASDSADANNADDWQDRKGSSWGNAISDNACDLVLANLSAYQDGELDDLDTRLVAGHMGKCKRCAGIFAEIQAADETIEREWRESAPLPSALRLTRNIDDIMAALPPVPAEIPAFAPHRVHARARWMRFASGAAGVLALLASLWSSYQLGYARGRRSAASQSAYQPVSPSDASSAPHPRFQPAAKPSVQPLLQSSLHSLLYPASHGLPAVSVFQRPGIRATQVYPKSPAFPLDFCPNKPYTKCV